MAWYDFPAWFSAKEEAVDAYKSDMRRSAGRPLGLGERLVLAGGAAVAVVMIVSVPWRILS